MTKPAMNKKSDEAKTKSLWDNVLWALVIILLVAGLWANYHYSAIDWPLRLAGWIILACIIVAIASITALGKRIFLFAKEARGELRKVYWPTRQETIQTTMVVVGMVMVMAIVLWGIDSGLLGIVSWLTGPGNTT